MFRHLYTYTSKCQLKIAFMLVICNWPCKQFEREFHIKCQRPTCLLQSQNVTTLLRFTFTGYY